jgi:uncharacterized membrane protein YccC
MAAVLLSVASTVALCSAVHRDGAMILLIVVLTMSLARSQRAASTSDWLRGLAVLPVCTVGACEIRALMASVNPVAGAVGDGLFCMAVSATIWVRRFGPPGPAVGKLAVATLVAALVNPGTVGGGIDALVTGVAAGLALGWVWLAERVARRTGFVPLAPPAPPATPPVRGPNTGWSTPTRLAVQMAAALAVALLVGHLVFGGHWPWVVLTAFIVCSGNRGRGEVVYKSALRVLGGIGGTAVATGLVASFGAHSVANLVTAFVVLVVASWLRPFNYAWWAGGVTAMLAFSYGYLGESGLGLLLVRLSGIVLGGVVGVAASWLILPIRTTDAVRKRLNAALDVLAELVSGLRTGADLTGLATRYDDAVAALEQISPPLVAHRRLTRGRPARHPWHRLADAGVVLRGCLEPVRLLAERARSSPPSAWTSRTTELLGAAEATLTTARSSFARPAAADRASAPDHDDAGVHGLDEQLASLATALSSPSAL